ncbi:hypothetical protein [Sphingomonas sp. SUN039]|nr:hypothetical protein [Sphingomonas sp. SUN039]UVO55332.1 hypothetical protein M0209_14800 [Sphingomonas sp. SUN039]
MRDVLPDVFGTAKTMLTAEFLDRVAAALPVLDGGKYRREVEAVLKDGT